mgnify:CR=1 FL=1
MSSSQSPGPKKATKIIHRPYTGPVQRVLTREEQELLAGVRAREEERRKKEALRDEAAAAQRAREQEENQKRLRYIFKGANGGMSPMKIGKLLPGHMIILESGPVELGFLKAGWGAFYGKLAQRKDDIKGWRAFFKPYLDEAHRTAEEGSIPEPSKIVAFIKLNYENFSPYFPNFQFTQAHAKAFLQLFKHAHNPNSVRPLMEKEFSFFVRSKDMCLKDELARRMRGDQPSPDK